MIKVKDLIVESKPLDLEVRVDDLIQESAGQLATTDVVRRVPASVELYEGSDHRTIDNVMEKRFFAVVPYDSIQIPQAGMDLAEKALGWLKSKTAKTPEQKKSENLEESLEQLDKRLDQVVSGLNQTGLRAVPLNNDELLELFYNLYNPATIEKKVEF